MPKKFKVLPTFQTGRKNMLFGDYQERGDEFIYLGQSAEIGAKRKVLFDISTEHVVGIVGKRGSGKSYTLGSISEAMCTLKRESSISKINRERAVLLFDTLDIYWTTKIPISEKSGKKIIKDQYKTSLGWDINPEVLDVQVFVPAGHRSDTMPPDFREFYLNTSDFTAYDWGALLNVDIIQDHIGQLLNEVYQKVTINGWKDRREFHPAIQIYGIEDLLQCARNDIDIQNNYHPETQRAVIQQLIAYGSIPLFSKSGTNINELLKKGRLSILLLSRLSEDLRGVLVAVLIRKIQIARARASFNKKRLLVDENLTKEEEERIKRELNISIPPAWIVIDEAQNVIPVGRKATCTDVLIKLVKEGRNFGISFAFTTQQPTAINTQIMSQVDTLIVHKLAVQKDIEEIRKNLKSNEPRETKYGNTELTFNELLRSLDLGQAFVTNTDVERSFLIDIRPRVSVHGGVEA